MLVWFKDSLEEICEGQSNDFPLFLSFLALNINNIFCGNVILELGITLISSNGEIYSCLGFLQIIPIGVCKWSSFLHVWNQFFFVTKWFVYGFIIMKSMLMSIVVASGYNVTNTL
jgi:hypothetical protein